MHIAIVSIGSRGDMQPYVALGLGLQSAGHSVRLVTHREYETTVRARGLDFAPIAGDPRDAMASEEGKAWLESQSNPILFVRRFQRLALPLVMEAGRDALAGCAGADLILTSTLGLFAAQAAADYYRVPLIPTPLQPLQMTRHLPNTIFPPLDGLLAPIYNPLTYTLGRRIMWGMFGAPLNAMRREVMHLPPTTARIWTVADAPLILYGFSPHVIPYPPDWQESAARICGYWFLDAPPDFTPPPDLVAWLDAGEPPVYIGFGSMNTRDPEATTRIVTEALMRAEQRGVLLTGWGGMVGGAQHDHIYHLDAIPHDWLFPHMRAVVHHGGIGTTAAGFRAGVPTVVVPFFADQPFWAQRVQRLGAGTAPIPRPRLDAAKLAAAIRQTVTDTAMRERAAELGRRLRAEDGVGVAVAAIAGWQDEQRRI